MSVYNALPNINRVNFITVVVERKHVGIVGGGPSALFMYKRLIESKEDLTISIFEKSDVLGKGMPYGAAGACKEHITNVSDNEIPKLVTSVQEWSKNLSQNILANLGINKAKFNAYKVLPRLLFGEYLADQFKLLKAIADDLGIETHIFLNTTIVDVIDQPKAKKTAIVTSIGEKNEYDRVIICTGHNWPKRYEDTVKGYFDSPYPPVKLKMSINHPVAIRGSSLTAIDAIRTLARHNGIFREDKCGKLNYQLNASQKGFKIVLHSRSGLLPAVRFHLSNTRLCGGSLLTKAEILKHREENGGFVSLDYIFEHNFKAQLLQTDPAFYHEVKTDTLEEFVKKMMNFRGNLDAFTLLKAEYTEANKSIKRHQSVYWKELLAMLSVALNYPAKYFSAEDMLRLQKTLMPLISIVIAFVPQTSCKELIALHGAGLLSIVSVGENSSVIPNTNGGANYKYVNCKGGFEEKYFETFIDCVGQPHLNIEDFPFKSLVNDKTIVAAQLMFKNNTLAKKMQSENANIKEDQKGQYNLKISGIAINDNFQVTDSYGKYSERIYIMAVPYIGGFNPDYSGLDFCEAAANRIGDTITNRHQFA